MPQWVAVELVPETRGRHRSKRCPLPTARSQLPESHTAAAAAMLVTTGKSCSSLREMMTFNAEIFGAVHGVLSFSLTFNQSGVFPSIAAC